MKPIDIMMNEVAWEPVKYDTPQVERDGIPYVTHTGILKIGEFEFHVHNLSNGKRVINGKDLEDFFLGKNST